MEHLATGAAVGAGALRITLGPQFGYVRMPVPEGVNFATHSELAVSLRLKSADDLGIRWYAFDGAGNAIWQRRDDLAVETLDGEWHRHGFPLSGFRWGNRHVNDWSMVRELALVVFERDEPITVDVDELTVLPGSRGAASAWHTDEWLRSIAFGQRDAQFVRRGRIVVGIDVPEGEGVTADDLGELADRLAPLPAWVKRLFGDAVRPVGGDLACDGLIVLDQINESNWGVVNRAVRQRLKEIQSDKLPLFIDSRAHLQEFDFGILKGNQADSADATIPIVVAAVNDAPTAGADVLTTQEDVAVTFNASILRANDSRGPANESSQSLTAALPGGATEIDSANGGTASISNAEITYTPPTNFVGSDTFVYEVTDDGLPTNQSALGTVTVTITSVNDPPVPGDDTKIADEDTMLVFDATDLLANDGAGPLSATDEVSEILTVTGVSPTSDEGGTLFAGFRGDFLPAASRFRGD